MSDRTENQPASSCCAAGRSEGPASLKPDISGKDSQKPKAPSSWKEQEMIHLPGGSFLMGTNDNEGFPADGEGPVREITLAPFYIDPCTVSNAEFARFVEATGYITESEKFGWSYVFHLLVSEATARTVTRSVE
ncbi:formylglycine-generating enzyme family protein, partial [Paenibacillus sepulcri]|nr:formylglycine-generating enzyme family protein [Paenibacillus sepulcri]